MVHPHRAIAQCGLRKEPTPDQRPCKQVLSSEDIDSGPAPSVRRCQSTALRPRTPSVGPTRGGVSPGGPRPSGSAAPAAPEERSARALVRNAVVHQEGGVRLGRPSLRTSIRSASHLPALASTRRIAADTASSRLLGSVGAETELGSAVIRPTKPAQRARESERVPRCSPSGTRRVPLGVLVARLGEIGPVVRCRCLPATASAESVDACPRLVPMS